MWPRGHFVSRAVHGHSLACSAASLHHTDVYPDLSSKTSCAEAHEHTASFLELIQQEQSAPTAEGTLCLPRTSQQGRSNATRQQGDAAGGAADPRAEAALRPEGLAGGAPNPDGARQPGSGGAAEGARPEQAAREPDLGNKAADEELDEAQQASPFEPDLPEQVGQEAPVLTEQAAQEQTLVARVSSDASFVSATGSLASAMSDGPRSADKRSYLKSAEPAAAGLEGGPVATPRDPELQSSNLRAERGSAPTNGRAEPPGVALGDSGVVSGGPGALEGRSESPFVQAVRGLGGDTTRGGAGVGTSAEPGPVSEPLSGLGSGRVSAELPVSHHAAAPALSLASPSTCRCLAGMTLTRTLTYPVQQGAYLCSALNRPQLLLATARGAPHGLQTSVRPPRISVWALGTQAGLALGRERAMQQKRRLRLVLASAMLTSRVH